MRCGERDNLVHLLEERQGLSHNKAAALISPSSIQSATLPVLGARDRTDMIGATRFDLPAPPVSPQRAGTAGPARRVSPPQGVSSSALLTPTRATSASALSPDRFGRDGPKPARPKAPASATLRRPLPPTDRRLGDELTAHRLEGPPSGYTPPSGLRKDNTPPSGHSATSLSATRQLSGAQSAAADAAARKRDRWVHHPTCELWQLRGKPGGRLQWSAVVRWRGASPC